LVPGLYHLSECSQAEEARIRLLTDKVLPREDLFFEYWDKQVRNKKGQTRNNYAVTRRQLSSYLPENILIGDITREPIEDFVEHLKAKYKENSAWLYFSKLKHIFNLAIKDGSIRVNPCNAVTNKPQRVETSVEYLELSEIQLLKDTECFDPEFKRAFLFSCFTGLRIWSEVVQLTWDNIKGNQLVYKDIKTKREQTQYLNSTALEFLGERRGGKCFELLFGIHYLIVTAMPEWLARAGIKKKVTPKFGRHTFGTHVQSIGKDVYLTQKAIGHKTLENTQVYAKIAEERIKKVLDDYSL